MAPLANTYGYSTDIFVELPKRVEPYPLFGMMAEVHENLRQLQNEIESVSAQGQQNVFADIASAVGSVLEAVGDRASKLVNALGTTIKASAEGLGTLSKDVISSSGDALTDTIKSN